MSTRIPQTFIDDVLARTDIVELIDSYVPLRKKGTSYSACCPFHNEKTPSFHVSLSKQLYHCFGCDAGGNALSFVMAHENLDFIEALKLLAGRAGLELPKDSLSQEQPSNSVLYSILEEATRYFQKSLKENQQAIDYLKKRGISGQTAKTFCLGYAPPHWDNLCKNFLTRYKSEDLFKVGLILKKERGGFYDRFRDRIMFPIRDIQGRVIAFGGRVLTSGEPKYLNSPETPLFQKGKELYGLHEARKTCNVLDSIWVVEGYLDLMALVQAGIPNVVATLGTAITSSHLKRLFRSTSEIVICFDGDKAGQQAAWRALEALLPLMEDDYRARFVKLPQGEDPDTYVQKVGQDQFLKISSATMPEFFFGMLMKQIDIKLPEGRAKFAKQASEHLKKIPGKFLQQIMLDRLSRLVHIEVDRLISLSELPTIKSSSSRSSYRAATKPRLSSHSPVRLIITLLLQYPHLSEEIELSSELNTLSLPGISILMELYEQIKKNQGITTGILLEHWRERPEEKILRKLANQNHCIPENGVISELKGAFSQLQALGIEQRINGLLEQGQLRGLTIEEKKVLQELLMERQKATSFSQ